MPTMSSRSRLVAATRRKSLSTSRTSPTGRKRRSSSARRNAPCTGRGSSPTSSRNSVPWSAAARRPSRALSAPVNAPRACPNRCASTSVSGKVVQSTVTNGPDARRLLACRALANSSLPVPVSPVMSTLTLLAAASRNASSASASAGLFPMMSGCRSRLRDWLSRLFRHCTACVSAFEEIADAERFDQILPRPGSQGRLGGVGVAMPRNDDHIRTARKL